MWYILYILMRTFFVLWKSSFPSWPCRLFQNILTQGQGDVFNWSSLVINIQIAINSLTLSWWRPLSYRNQSIDLLRKETQESLKRVKRDSRESQETQERLKRLKSKIFSWSYQRNRSSSAKRLWASLFLQILQIATERGVHHRFFCGSNVTSKHFNCHCTF